MIKEQGGLVSLLLCMLLNRKRTARDAVFSGVSDK
jgi:hypothetical protein